MITMIAMISGFVNSFLIFLREQAPPCSVTPKFAGADIIRPQKINRVDVGIDPYLGGFLLQGNSRITRKKRLLHTSETVFDEILN